MKKILLSVFLFGGSLIGINAQTITFLDKEGKTIADGSTYVFEGYNIFDGSMSENGYAEYVTLEFNPHIQLEVSQAGDVTLQTTSLNGENYQLCFGDGSCDRSEVFGLTLVKNGIPMKANTPEEIAVEALPMFMDTYVKIPEYEILVEAWYTLNPSSKVSFTLKMGDVGDAGLDGIAADANFVKVVGKSLNFDVVGNANISVYSLSGKTLVNKTVAGSGSISLGNLPKGVYVYKVAGKNGKSGKFIIK